MLPNRSGVVHRFNVFSALVAAVFVPVIGCAQQPAAPYVPGAPPIVVECLTPYDSARRARHWLASSTACKCSRCRSIACSSTITPPRRAWRCSESLLPAR